MSIEVRNPHSVLATLQTRPNAVKKLVIPGKAQDAWIEVGKLAGKKGIKTSKDAPQGRHDRKGGGRQSQPMALIEPKASVEIDDLLKGSKASNPLWLALDCIQDPQNLGAIFRSASFFGVQGIVMTKDRSAGMTGVVYDVSCGGVEHVPFAQVGNLVRAMEQFKESEIWILGTSEHAKEPLSRIKRDRPWCVVIGNEEKGMRRLTEENCDQICTIKSQTRNGVQSLNASVATGILISSLSSL